MPAPPFPKDEAARLAALRVLNLLDSKPETRFDRVTKLAAKIFTTPLTAFTLVDERRVWLKSKQGGAPMDETPREHCFGALVKHDDVCGEISLFFIDFSIAKSSFSEICAISRRIQAVNLRPKWRSF